MYGYVFGYQLIISYNFLRVVFVGRVGGLIHILFNIDRGTLVSQARSFYNLLFKIVKLKLLDHKYDEFCRLEIIPKMLDPNNVLLKVKLTS